MASSQGNRTIMNLNLVLTDPEIRENQQIQVKLSLGYWVVQSLK